MDKGNDIDATPSQYNKLVAWAAKNAAQRAARQQATNPEAAPIDGELAERIADLEAEFANRPDRHEETAQRLHDQERQLLIYEEAIRILVAQLPASPDALSAS